jgi:DNA topoisomerase-3
LTWFFGHLLEQIKPDEYSEKYKPWKIEDLPIIPDTMIYKYKGVSQKDQGQSIFALCQRSDEIICGTDPDREGQGIFDTFIKYHQLEKPMKRLWATSLTEKDLMKAWSRMRDMKEYCNLSSARELRADSDWLVGMNASRAYSIIAKGKIPVGRVLTATLSIIVKRDLEVESYKESFFYQLKGTWCGFEFTYFDENGTKFDDREILDNIKASCEHKPFSMNRFKVESKIENPPKTFNLPDLQKEANRKFGFSLDKTLELAQSLYEKKLTTYPRTDSPYLPESDLAEYQELVKKVATPEEAKFLRPAGEKPACVKDTDSPHSALIVTGEKTSLRDDEAKIYELIRSRMVCAFMIPRHYRQFDLEITEGSGIFFRATIRQDIDPGFRKIYKEAEIRDDEIQRYSGVIDEAVLRSRNEKMSVISVTQSKKTKPKYYTPATLITAMQTCGRTLENENARKMLAETKGIGTPATQAKYPQQLIKYEYISEQNNFFISTSKGRKIIAEIAPDLKTPELTADWEMKLKLVENGKLTVELYTKEIHEYVKKIVEDAKQRLGKINFVSGNTTDLSCPQCTKDILKKNWGYICESKECGFSVNFKIAEKNLPQKELENLFRKNETSIIKGFKKKDGSGTFDAKLVIKDECGKKSVVFEFENTICPKCKTASIRIFPWGAACTDREKCSFKIFREVAHKKITDTQIKKLVKKGMTDVIKGFKNSKGNVFDARLVLDDNFLLKFKF